MRKFLERITAFVGLGLLVAAGYLCHSYCVGLEKTVQIFAILFAFEFFVYKLCTGWLISNLNVQIEPLRESFNDAEDHLSIKLTLTKGAIDSLWLKAISIRLSEIKPSTEKGLPGDLIKIIEPIGYAKRFITEHDYWDGTRQPKYTLSIGEEATFSAYATIKKGIVLAAEVVVVGTRFFYGIETQKNLFIQWRSSVIVLPLKVEITHSSL